MKYKGKNYLVFLLAAVTLFICANFLPELYVNKEAAKSVDGQVSVGGQQGWQAGTYTNLNIPADGPISINNTGAAEKYNLSSGAISSDLSLGNEANAVDGNFSTSWGPVPIGLPCETHYWSIDAGTPLEVGKIGLSIHNGSLVPVFGSNNGSDWTQVGSFVASEFDYLHVLDTPVTYRYWKVNVQTWNCNPGPYDVILIEFELYPPASGIHTSAASQLDSGAHDSMNWTTFTPDGVIPNDHTFMSFRFRTSANSTDWPAWSAAVPYAASIDLSGLAQQRYLQVETTLANTDGSSTPTLNSYTAYYDYTDAPPPPTCSDGIKNGDETGIDTGGSCPPAPTCFDGIQNQGETGIDTGGPCLPAPNCNDGIKNGDETGIDTGGSCQPVGTCIDGIKNQDETDIDCGGVCGTCPKPPVCKINECLNDAVNEYNTCSTQNPKEFRSSCADNYCEAAQKCEATCGNDGASFKTKLLTPNGGERYLLGGQVPISWVYTDSSLNWQIFENVAILMSVSLDSGVTYHPVKLLIPKNKSVPDYQSVLDNNSAVPVDQYKLIGSYNNMGRADKSSYLLYNWVPENSSYVSDKLRIRLEPQFFNCIIAMQSDDSDHDFEIYDQGINQILSVTISPVSGRLHPGESLSFTATARLKDGTDVTESTDFSFTLRDGGELVRQDKNTAEIRAGETLATFDDAVTVIASREGLQAKALGGFEVYGYPLPSCSGFLCEIINAVRGLGDSSAGTSLAATLLALLIALGNLIPNAVLISNQLIAPFVKGRDKKTVKSTVYDSLTGIPLKGIKIMSINIHNGLRTLESMVVSDHEGKYALNVSPGKRYEIKAESQDYAQMPSTSTALDRSALAYNFNYFGAEFEAAENEFIFNSNIPLIEINTAEHAQKVLKRTRLTRVLIALNLSILFVGAGLAVIIALAYPTTINYLILCLYGLTFLLYIIRTATMQGKSFGIIYNLSDLTHPVELGIVRAVRSQDGRLEKTVVSDEHGKYSLAIPKGKYEIFVTKQGLKQQKNLEIKIASSFKPQNIKIGMVRGEGSNSHLPNKDDHLGSNDENAGYNSHPGSAEEIIENYHHL